MSGGRFDVHITREAHHCKQCDQRVYVETSEECYDVGEDGLGSWGFGVAGHVDRNGRVVPCTGKIDRNQMERVL